MVIAMSEHNSKLEKRYFSWRHFQNVHWKTCHELVDPLWNRLKFLKLHTCHVEIIVQTFLKITRPAYRLYKLYLTIVGPNSHEKMTKYEIRLLFAPILFYLPLLGPKIPCLSIFNPTYLYLPLFTYIWPNVTLITLICSYLPLIVLISPYVPYSPRIDNYSIATAYLCQILEQSDYYSWIYCI